MKDLHRFSTETRVFHNPSLSRSRLRLRLSLTIPTTTPYYGRICVRMRAVDRGCPRKFADIVLGGWRIFGRGGAYPLMFCPVDELPIPSVPLLEEQNQFGLDQFP